MCEAALVEAPASIVALEATPDNLEALVGFLGNVNKRFPQAVVAMLLAPELESVACMLREAGALETIASVLEAPRLARLARRHHARAPKPAMTVHEFVADQMPWAAYATPSGST